MRCFYTDAFVLPLPPEHRFPMQKYRLLRERVEAELPWLRLEVPAAASDVELQRAHAPEYVAKVAAGHLSTTDMRAIGFPWSPEMVERSRRSAGATLGACRSALQENIAVNLAGGTHHARRDAGAGFCVFNDAAVAARAMQAESLAARIAIIDLDVHQGDGTAAIFAGDPSVYTLSVHGAKNYPFRKERSRLDVELADGAGGAEYLAALDAALARLFGEFDADLVIYLAGADPYAGDRYGRLKLDKAALAERDARVYEACAARALPLAVAMAGGYADRIEDIVDIHFATVRLAALHWARFAPGCIVPALAAREAL
ncbi:MAG: histone deacetylase [Rhodocyclaceae bacterium]|nr:histone deacetylase [Rhodocyclaceae bacterium]MBX3668724.1 histone deacetylase [Rhodocyclaceae bacterium]